MNDFFKSFGAYCKEAELDSIWFWAIPLGTILLIWLLTITGLKIFKRESKLKTVFFVNRAWVISSLILAGIIIGLICYGWSINFFAQHPLQLSLLIALSIAMLIPVLSLLNLRSYYTSKNLKEIIDQPKTKNQLDDVIVVTKKAFATNKYFFIIPAIGFLLLLFYLNKGTNLITLVYDNSESMHETTAIDALSETFSNLDNNNEIILTTIEGYQENDRPPVVKTTMNEIMAANKSANLKAGNVVAFANPIEAKSGLNQISNQCYGSPICEGIWKTYLYIKENKSSENYANKLLIVITDGADNLLEKSLSSGKFFFDDEKFSEYFPPDNFFVIDYSNNQTTPFMQRVASAGCDIYPAENNKQAYLDALNNALQSFKNNWFLIYWTTAIFLLLTIVALLIQPKKIV